MPDKDLKLCLFQHAKDYYEKYIFFKQTLGEKNEMTIQCENKYYGCHLVICHSGLEDEYNKWLETVKEGDETDG